MIICVIYLFFPLFQVGLCRYLFCLCQFLYESNSTKKCKFRITFSHLIKDSWFVGFFTKALVGIILVSTYMYKPKESACKFALQLLVL